MQHLSCNGERLKGRYTIAKHFHTLLRQVAAAGDIAFVVDALDFQQLAEAVSATTVACLGCSKPSPPALQLVCII